jgi:hypothetical protein
MKKHPFRSAIESGVGKEEFAKIFSPDVVLYAPMLTQPVQGVDQVLNVVGHAAKVAGPIQYTLEVQDARQSILLWNGQVGGYKLEAVTILVDGEDGLIREVRVLMRTWPIVTLFRDAMYQELSAEIPADYWELGPKPASSAESRLFTPLALKPIEMASDVELHSPMLAKSVRGKSAVESALKMAHSIQSASSYTSIIATPDLLMEMFDCDADGYPMEGVWVSRLNELGLIEDLTVYLRPYPAVTVLRNTARELAGKTEELSFLTEEYWELPTSV